MASGSTGKLKEPKIPSEPEEAWKFVKEKLTYESAHRRVRAAIWSKALNYREGHQTWGSLSGFDDLVSTPKWTMNEPESDPTPTVIQNEMFVPLANEAARLGGEKLRPYIRPEDMDADQKDKEGALISERAVLHALDEMGWDDISDERDLHMGLFGQGILKSFWDLDRSKVVRAPVQTAKACPRHPSLMKPQESSVPAGDTIEGGPLFNPEPEDPQVVPPAGPTGLVPPVDPMAPPPPPAPMATGFEGPIDAVEPEPPLEESCDFTVAKSKIPMETAAGLPPETYFGIEQEETGISDYYVKKCPTCEDHPDLVDYQPSMEEAYTGKDAYGSPMGADYPLGEWKVVVISPWDFFMQDFGLRIKPGKWRWWMHVHVEDVDWILDHYGVKVEPENPSALHEHHPPATNLAGATDRYETGLFDHHARVIEYCSNPSADNPHGTHLTVSNGKILYQQDFMKESQNKPGVRYRCVIIGFTPWERRAAEAWGLSLAELMFDEQDAINRRLALGEDYAAKNGIPFTVAPNGANLTLTAVQGARGSTAGLVLGYEPSALAPTLEPHPMQVPNPPDVETFIAARVEAINRITGQSQIESGAPPQGVTAFLALRLLNEQGGEIRTPRKVRRRLSDERIFNHGQELLFHRALEPRPYAFTGDDGLYREEAYRGIEMRGVWKVKTEAEPEHGTRLIQQQQLQDMATNKIINLEDPMVKDKFLELMDAPRELGGGEVALQLKVAEREFSDLIKKGRPPVIDPLLDEHVAHYQQHARDLATDKIKDLERACDWDTLMQEHLWDWENAYNLAMMPPVPPPAPPAPDETGMVNPAVAQAAAQAPPPPPIPPEVQALMALQQIKSVELRIYKLWQILLVEAGVTPQALGDEAATALKVLLRFRAHAYAHKMIAEGQLSLAKVGQPVLAAPDAGAVTAAGTIPDPANPAVAATGSVAA